jgi:UDP-glucuronate 4-epimerase
MNILLTGIGGFIGFHVTKSLLKKGHTVCGIDNINDYYDVNLKLSRLKCLGLNISDIKYNKKISSKINQNLSFVKLDLKEKDKINKIFQNDSYDIVINLAAQAGVRYSLTNPYAYIDSNIYGFINILESCRHNSVKHLVYASSSSVYGLNELMPFSTHHNVDHPISLYAASKKSNELMAHTYSHLYGLPTTGLRFFTVYGPWGRPDMALFIFTKAILEDKPIEIYNNGMMQRDFTYIDDIVEGVIKTALRIPKGNSMWSAVNPDPSSSPSPYKIYNIGNNSPVQLLDFITAIENALKKRAKKNLLPMQPGDVPATYADVTDLVEDIGYKPDTSITEGINNFIVWYRDYYKV